MLNGAMYRDAQLAVDEFEPTEVGDVALSFPKLTEVSNLKGKVPD